MEGIRVFDYGRPQDQVFLRMRVDFDVELVVREGREFLGR
jgi:hypothetical protein